MTSKLTIGLPKAYAGKGNKCVPPTNDFLAGTWHVTHSTLPMWKDKRNVNITYTTLPANSSGVVKIDDLVRYQGIDSEKIQFVKGVDTPSAGMCMMENGQGKITNDHQVTRALGIGVVKAG
jgi:hypothetical protein